MPWFKLEIDDREAAAFAREYVRKGRFLVDESLGIEAARVIRKLGWNAIYVGEAGLAGKADEAVYAFAWRDDRVLLTHDEDFLDDRRFPPHRNPGLVVLPGASGETPGLNRELARVLSTIGAFREGYRRFKIHAHEDRTWTIKSARSGQSARLARRLKFDRDGTIWEWSGEGA